MGKNENIAGNYQNFLNPEGLYFFSLTLTAIGLGASNTIMSVGIGGMVIAAVWGRRWKFLLRQLREKPYYFGFPAIYLLFVLGILWGDAETGLVSLQIKLPLLILPLAVAAFPPLPEARTRLFMGITGMALHGICLTGMLIYLKWIPWEADDIRKISPFISHIRLSTLLALAALFSVWGWATHFHRSVFWLVSAFFWAGFIVLMKSLTGLLELVFVGGFIFPWLVRRQIGKRTQRILIGCGIVFLGYAGYIMQREYRQIWNPEKLKAADLPQTTFHGNVYKYDTNAVLYINGYHVYSYISPYELSTAWNARSEIPFTGNTSNGFLLEDVLVRYLASKGLRKNREAVESLSEKEIQCIESGITNARSYNSRGIEGRINQTLNELEHYLRTGDPNAQSLSMRFEIWKIGLNLARSQPLWGTGTGANRQALETAYQQSDTLLMEIYWYNPHNQFLSVWITLGIGGLLCFLVLMLMPLRWKSVRKNALFLVVLAVILVAMSDEDTLETQAGVTQVAFLYALTLFGLSLPQKHV